MRCVQDEIYEIGMIRVLGKSVPFLAQVMNEAASLFGDLDALFFNSWARPGVDLQPEILQLS